MALKISLIVVGIISFTIFFYLGWLEFSFAEKKKRVIWRWICSCIGLVLFLLSMQFYFKISPVETTANQILFDGFLFFSAFPFGIPIVLAIGEPIAEYEDLVKKRNDIINKMIKEYKENHRGDEDEK